MTTKNPPYSIFFTYISFIISGSRARVVSPSWMTKAGLFWCTRTVLPGTMPSEPNLSSLMCEFEAIKIPLPTPPTSRTYSCWTIGFRSSLALLQHAPPGTGRPCGQVGGWPRRVHIESVTSGESVCSKEQAFFSRFSSDNARTSVSSLSASLWRLMAPSASLSPWSVSVMVSPLMFTSPSFIILARVLLSASSATSSMPRSCFTEWLPISLWLQMNSSTSSTAFPLVLYNSLLKRYSGKPYREVHDRADQYGEREYEKRHPNCRLKPPSLHYHEEVGDARHKKSHGDERNYNLHRVEHAVLLEREQSGGAVVPAQKPNDEGLRGLGGQVKQADDDRGGGPLYRDKGIYLVQHKQDEG